MIVMLKEENKYSYDLFENLDMKTYMKIGWYWNEHGKLETKN